MFEAKDQISESIVEDMRYNNWGSKNEQYCDVVMELSHRKHLVQQEARIFSKISCSLIK